MGGATHGADNDTVTNTGTGYVKATVTAGWSSLSVAWQATKKSGTVAGTAYLQGSVDGTNWTQISADSTALTNVTTNAATYTNIPDYYSVYRVYFSGGTTTTYTILGRIIGISPVAETK